VENEIVVSRGVRAQCPNDQRQGSGASCLGNPMMDEERMRCEKLSVVVIIYLFICSTHTQPFYGPFSGTTRVSRCQKKSSGRKSHQSHPWQL